jgi:hypothetical protein
MTIPISFDIYDYLSFKKILARMTKFLILYKEETLRHITIIKKETLKHITIRKTGD